MEPVYDHFSDSFIVYRAALRATSGTRKDVDGVRTVKYNRLALEFKELYTWVFIGVKEAEIMKVNIARELH